MYIKIGKTDIKYRSGVDDYMIFSEVPDSQLSYEKPILVRTKDELDIWFGRDFASRDYYDELLKKGVTLYLYKPIKKNNTHDIDDYIDIETYYIFPEIFLNLPENGEPGYTYYLQTTEPLKHYYKFGLEESTGNYTWLPLDTFDGYELDPREFASYYDLPNIGVSGHAYYVTNLPEARFWYIFENGEWKEAGKNYKTYIPWRRLFSDPSTLPYGGGSFKYFVIFDMSWYRWEESEWIKTTEEDPTQEFPIHFDTVDDLPWPGDNYRYYVDGEWYIWTAFSWTSEALFPQNIDNISNSLTNRDTLMISKKPVKEIETIPYSYPEFRLYNDNNLGVFSRDYDLNFKKEFTISKEELESINLGYRTMAFKLSYIPGEDLGDGYIIVKNIRPEDNNNSKGCLLFYGDNKPDISALLYFESKSRINTIDDLISQYKILGYKVEKSGENEYLIYASQVFEFTEFYTYPNITLTNDFEDTHNILTKYLEKNKGFEFYSKTIGTAYTNSENDKNSLISVKIEDTDYEKYRVTIRRYDYSEIYEGPLFSAISEERLDSLINKDSKLVVCDLSGLKNYIKPIIYRGLIEDVPLESEDFSVKFRTKSLYCYIPPEPTEEGYRYLECYDLYGNEIWKVWDTENLEWKEITPADPDFYDLEDKALDFPTFSDLPETGDSMYRYYVDEDEKWYTWENNEYIIFKTGIVVGSEYTIKINRLGYEEYALYIVAGELNETYTGNLFDLEDEINENSRIFESFEFKNLCNELKTGTYYLRRGKNEEQTPDMYLKSLGCLFDTQIENIWPDFFLIPDIRKYINNLGEFEDLCKDVFLEHAKNFNCQFLIQNNNPKYEIKVLGENESQEKDVIYTNKDETEYILNGEPYTDIQEIESSVNGGDFIYNYIKDTSNYLVYFYRPLTLYGNPRPAYYMFLEGLLRNIYSLEETKVNYDSPLESDPYELSESALVEILEKRKSNFLINNNHIFYYKKYFNGPKYYSTVWMRFTLGKIYRELHKNKWSYLAQKSPGIIETAIRNTLEKIQNRFSIVRFINLVKFTPKLEKNYLELTIDTYVSDLMNNNMTLDITVNYNETNTD